MILGLNKKDIRLIGAYLTCIIIVILIPISAIFLIIITMPEEDPIKHNEYYITYSLDGDIHDYEIIKRVVFEGRGPSDYSNDIEIHRMDIYAPNKMVQRINISSEDFSKKFKISNCTFALKFYWLSNNNSRVVIESSLSNISINPDISSKYRNSSIINERGWKIIFVTEEDLSYGHIEMLNFEVYENEEGSLLISNRYSNLINVTLDFKMNNNSSITFSSWNITEIKILTKPDSDFLYIYHRSYLIYWSRNIRSL